MNINVLHLEFLLKSMYSIMTKISYYHYYYYYYYYYTKIAFDILYFYSSKTLYKELALVYSFPHYKKYNNFHVLFYSCRKHIEILNYFITEFTLTNEKKMYSTYPL